MPFDPSKLSVAEIRRRLTGGGEPLTPAVLARLRRDPRRGARALYETLRRRHERERDRRARLDAMLNFERVLWQTGLERVAGVDEAGTGPMAGPVVAAAVWFPRGTAIDGIDDSKKLDPATRLDLAREIEARAGGIGVGVAEVAEIERLNVYRAALLAMRRAVLALPEPPQHLLVDARRIPGVDAPQNPFVKGDGLDFSIAAASIVAKTTRDRMMERLDERYPGYGFARHKGYCTAAHQDAVRRLGPCAIHRRSYPFLRELCGRYSERFYELHARLRSPAGPAELADVERAVERARPALGDEELRKLRLLLARRWKRGGDPRRSRSPRPKDQRAR